MITKEMVYNKWLAVTRSQRGKPFQLRRNFEGIETEEWYPYLMQLTVFFQRHPNLFSDKFFEAPFRIYSIKNGYYSLKFYSSHKGIVACSKYFKELDAKGSEEQVSRVKESYQFIGRFCVEKGILLNEYPFYQTGAYPDCLIHLKDHLVSFFTIFSFPSLYSRISSLDSDDRVIFFGEDFRLMDYQKKYMSSVMLKKKSQEYFGKVMRIIQEKNSKKT